MLRKLLGDRSQEATLEQAEKAVMQQDEGSAGTM
jgi:hypothetical protein